MYDFLCLSLSNADLKLDMREVLRSSQKVSYNSFVRPLLPGNLSLDMFIRAQRKSSSEGKNSQFADCSSVSCGIEIKF